MLSLPEYSRFAISLFAVLGPVTAVPAFLSHTEGLTSTETSRTAIVAASTAALVLIVAAVTGQTLLPMLGTSLGSLQIAGGLIMLLMGLSRLNPSFEANRSRIEHSSSTGVVPLGFPLLAGPGSISAVIVAIGHGSGVAHAAAVVGCVLANCATVWVVLRAAHPIAARLGRRGLNAANRLFAFLLACIAVEIITAGLRALFPVFA